jgi:hypothetical protein
MVVVVPPVGHDRVGPEYAEKTRPVRQIQVREPLEILEA